MPTAHRVILRCATGLIAGLISLAAWVALGVAIRTLLGSLLRSPSVEIPSPSLLFLLLVFAAGVGGAAGALRDHALRIPLKLLGRFLNLLAFLLASGLSNLKFSMQNVWVELDLSAFALVLALVHILPQTFLDVYELHLKGAER